MQDVELCVKYVFGPDRAEDRISGKDIQEKVYGIQAHLAQQLEKVLWYQQGIFTMRYSVVKYLGSESGYFDLNGLAPDLFLRITLTSDCVLETYGAPSYVSSFRACSSTYQLRAHMRRMLVQLQATTLVEEETISSPEIRLALGCCS